MEMVFYCDTREPEFCDLYFELNQVLIFVYPVDSFFEIQRIKGFLIVYFLIVTLAIKKTFNSPKSSEYF